MTRLPPSLRSEGRYWVSRALFELGQLSELDGQPDNARQAYEIILDYRLPGDYPGPGPLSPG